ncbi:MAG: preprotein translocase subunit YajC [Alphaproteobacteria bacterium]|nr:preprotein translocase subunit YajC [Alphaproteobacteria bacterium]
MFISTALAQTADVSEAAAPFSGMIVQFGLIFAVFYFLLIRPQQKKLKDHQEMLTSVKSGDNIVTGGGIVAKVAKVIGEDKLLIDVDDGVRMTIMRSSVGGLITNDAKD